MPSAPYNWHTISRTYLLYNEIYFTLRAHPWDCPRDRDCEHSRHLRAAPLQLPPPISACTPRSRQPLIFVCHYTFVPIFWNFICVESFKMNSFFVWLFSLFLDTFVCVCCWEVFRFMVCSNIDMSLSLCDLYICMSLAPILANFGLWPGFLTQGQLTPVGFSPDCGHRRCPWLLRL